MTWIHKGRSVVSDDGRWRIARVFRGWTLYDRGVDLGNYPTADSAKNKVHNELRIEERRPHV